MRQIAIKSTKRLSNDNLTEVKDFCKLYRLTENQFYGHQKINGSLDFRGLKTLPKGCSLTTVDNLGLQSLKTLPEGCSLTVGGSLGLGNLKTLPEGCSLTAGGDLYLENLKTLPEGCSLTVGGSLGLQSLKTLPKGCSLTAGRNLYLGSLKTLPEGCSLTAGGSLGLGSLKTLPEGCSLTAGGNLYLKSLETLPEGCSLTAGNSLDLENLKTLPEGCSLTAGGSLYLKSLETLPEGCSLTAGNSLYLKNQTVETTTKPIKNKLLFWRDGKYVLADGIFTEVVARKGCVYIVKNVGSEKHYYLATDGKSCHAHGESIEQAKTDLRFKKTSEKLKGAPISPDTVITVPYYRVITGACATGVKHWMDATFTDKQKINILKNGIRAGRLFPILKKKKAYGFEKFQSLFKKQL